MTRVGTEKDTVSVIKHRIEAYENEIRIITTDFTNDRYFEQAEAELIAAIELNTKRLAALRNRRANGPQLIKDARENIKKAKKELQLALKQAEIQKLLDMAAALAEAGV